MTALILDAVPWWAWLFMVAVVLTATVKLWAPLWALVPQPARLMVGAGLAAILAYLAGRNVGSAGAANRADKRDADNADRINQGAADARAGADALNTGRRLRDDDGWRRTE